MKKSLIKLNQEPSKIEIKRAQKQTEFLISPKIEQPLPLPLLMLNQPEFIALKPTNVNFPMQFEV